MADDIKGMILTENGRNLLAQAMTGKTLTFTRAFIGDGIAQSNTDLSKITSLISPKKELAIQSITKTSQIGTCEIVLEISNQNLTQGFFVNEYGVFAKIDNEAEILYCYRNTGANLQFLPGDNGVDLIHFTLSVVTVIAQAQNVQAVINSQNSYVTVPVLEGKMLSLFSGKSKIQGLWSYSVDGEKILRPQSIDEIKQAVLGAGNVSEIIKRVEVLENNLAQILLELEMQSLFPGYSHYIIEDFINVNQIDMFECKITSIVAGDDSIDCSPIEGLIPGSWYMISDGLLSELVQIHSINVENSVLRIILEEPVKNTYILDNCRMYRTSCVIDHNLASGPGINHSFTWNPNLEWRGISENTTDILELNTFASNSNSFSLTGNISLAADGYVSLI